MLKMPCGIFVNIKKERNADLFIFDVRTSVPSTAPGQNSDTATAKTWTAINYENTKEVAADGKRTPR